MSLEDLDSYLWSRLDMAREYATMGVVPGVQDSRELDMIKGRIIEIQKLQEVVHKMLCPSRPDSPESSA